MYIKYIIIFGIFFLVACSTRKDSLIVKCEKCNKENLVQFPVINKMELDDCNKITLLNISSDTLKVASIRDGEIHFFSQRRFKRGHFPNPYPALWGCDVGTIRYNILIPPKGEFSFPIDGINSPTKKYDKIEFEIKYKKNGIVNNKWIGCP